MGKLLAGSTRGVLRFLTILYLRTCRSISYNFFGRPDLFAICIEPRSRYLLRTNEMLFLDFLTTFAISLKAAPDVFIPAIKLCSSTDHKK